MALPNYAAYAASKAAVDSITRAAAVALAPYGVLVNSLAPGMMDTEMQRSTEATHRRARGPHRLRGLPRRAHRAVFRSAGVPRSPRSPPRVVWLALDAPDYMTAERLNMSGGLDKD